MEWREVGSGVVPGRFAVLAVAGCEVPPDGFVEAADDAVAWCVGATGSVSEVVGVVLRLLQGWLVGSGSRLVVVTRGGDPVSAAVRGLVRSAVSEHPGRFAVVDLDPAGGFDPVVLGAPEPWVAVRDGVVLVPRLVPVTVADGDLPVLGGGTVVVVGAGVVATAVGRALVELGAGRLVFVSRGGSAPVGVRGSRRM